MNPWLVVGLGNPGPTYARTRHNVGFIGVDDLAARAAVTFGAATRMRSLVAVLTIPAAPQQDAAKMLLAKPTTFMNESGTAVSALSAFYRIPSDKVIVLHDELDLAPGQLRIKFGGGDNGHNGLKSIRKHLGTGDFFRVRVGVGRPPGRQDPAAWVLAKMSSSELESMKVDAIKAADATLELIRSGLESAQNLFNS